MLKMSQRLKVLYLLSFEYPTKVKYVVAKFIRNAAVYRQVWFLICQSQV